MQQKTTRRTVPFHFGMESQMETLLLLNKIYIRREREREREDIYIERERERQIRN